MCIMSKVKVSGEFCIKVINSQRIKIKKCCFISCFFCCIMILIFQLNWNQRENLIERTILKSFLWVISMLKLKSASGE
jgi:hypothetical protein